MAQSGENSASADTTSGGDTGMPGVLNFLHHVAKLKHLDRTGWVKCGIERPETVSGHMYRMSIMSAFLIGDDDAFANLDRNKLIKMSIVHDLGESIVGDITPHCGVSNADKYAAELKAIDTLAKLVPTARGDEIRELFLEYEECKTEEARFVMGLDKFDMILQAYEYERREQKPRFLQQFFASTEQFFQITHPFVKKLALELYKARDNNVEFSVFKP